MLNRAGLSSHVAGRVPSGSAVAELIDDDPVGAPPLASSLAIVKNPQDPQIDGGTESCRNPALGHEKLRRPSGGIALTSGGSPA
jgi:hypothetical protein